MFNIVRNECRHQIIWLKLENYIGSINSVLLLGIGIIHSVSDKDSKFNVILFFPCSL